MTTTSPPPPRHPKFWFDDGSLELQLQHHSFKVHGVLLYGHSRALRLWSANPADDGPEVVQIPLGTSIAEADLVVLLEHLYHPDSELTPLDAHTAFPTLAALLRVSSAAQLDAPALHTAARAGLVRMFPSGPRPFAHPLPHVVPALTLAHEYGIHSIEKGLYYSLLKIADFDVEEETQDGSLPLMSSRSNSSSDTPSPSPPACGREPLLPETTVRRCQRLMTRLVAHAAGVLFTPSVGVHMECTDAFADAWMPLVITPVLGYKPGQGLGLYEPLEYLEYLMDLDWGVHGVCAECVRLKRAEWKGEQEEIWVRLDEWLA